jgi:hypothetical protein
LPESNKLLFKQILELENYTFLTPKPTTHEPNVYTGRKRQNLTTFSNNPHLTLFTTQSAQRSGILRTVRVTLQATGQRSDRDWNCGLFWSCSMSWQSRFLVMHGSRGDNAGGMVSWSSIDPRNLQATWNESGRAIHHFHAHVTCCLVLLCREIA